MSAPKSPAFASLATALRGAVNGVVVFAVTAWRARANRRAVVRLLHVEDHMLRDIGITRGDVVASLQMSPLADPSTHLRILAVERRAGRRAQARERLAHASGRRDAPNPPAGNAQEVRDDRAAETPGV